MVTDTERLKCNLICLLINIRNFEEKAAKIRLSQNRVLCPAWEISYSALVISRKTSIVMGAFKSIPKRTRQSQGDENDCRQQIVLFTGSSEKLAISYELRLAADDQKRFKVLVAVSSLSSGENLSDTKILKYLNTTLFMLQMDISSQEDTQNVVNRIKEEDGYLDAVGKTSSLFTATFTRTHH